MTKNITIADKNKAIAEFMGYEAYEDHYGIWFKKEGMIKCMHVKLQDLRYDQSWDWLMPVWCKFRDLKFESDKHTLQHSADKELIARLIAYHSIEDAHDALYDAIEWYQKLNK